MFRQFLSFFQVSPCWLVAEGKTNEIQKRLQQGLYPDHVYTGKTLLTIAIDYEKPEIITLLLRHGADTNRNVSLHPDRKIFAIDSVFHGRYSPALVKLLLTYGAKCNHIIEKMKQKKPTNPRLLWVESIIEKCHKFYSCLQQAEKQFKEEQFESAYENFNEAKKMLVQFKQAEEKKLPNPEYKSNQAYLENYRYRIQFCEERISQCKIRLQETNLDQGYPTERTPLLLTEARNLRRRTYFQKSQ